MKTWHYYLIFLLAGILIGVGSHVLFQEKKTVKVQINDSAIVDYFQHREDSIRKVTRIKFDSIQKTVPKQEQEIKIIYKTIEREKTVITFTRNIDSLRKGSIEYIEKSF